MFPLTPYELACKTNVSVERAEEVYSEASPEEWAAYCEDTILDHCCPECDW